MTLPRNWQRNARYACTTLPIRLMGDELGG